MRANHNTNTSKNRCHSSGVVAAQDVPAPALTPEEEFDLFGPSEDQNPFVGAANSGAASAMQSPVAKASAPLPGTTSLDLKWP